MTSTTIEFDHKQTAHCESGAMGALLRHNGLALSEPMLFGISGALTFAYIPLIKVGGMPMLAYRMPPGFVIKGVASRLGIKIKFERFRNPDAGMDALDTHLAASRPVGLQASVYWLPYFPEDMRFHFNAHNLVAFAHDGGIYYLSDPTFEQVVQADGESLRRARFVRGMLAPKGLIYYPTHIPRQPDLRGPITSAIRSNVNMMLRAPLPFVGARGIQFVADRIRRLARGSAADDLQNKLFIGHMVRMQEEIGTGGAGFRFLYASFLQESAAILDKPRLEQVSKDFTDMGDEWRRFALYAAKMLKGRKSLDYEVLADQLSRVAGLERDAFRQLKESVF